MQACTLDEASGCPIWTSDSSCGAGKRCKMKPGDPGTAVCCTPVCAGRCGVEDGCGGSCPDCGCSPTVAEVSAGSHHTCARTQDGTVWCWGGIDGSPVPMPVTGLDRKAIQISAGEEETCAVLEDGTLWCWGSNALGKLGIGPGPDQPVPVRVMALGNDVATVSTGAFHTCATLKDGTAWCWGDNDSHQLGSGPKDPRPTPGQVPGLANVTQIVAGPSATCAVKQDGTLWCWGEGGEGQLGGAQPGFAPGQVPALGSSVAQADIGAVSCAVKVDGTLWCWGTGVLGNGGTESFSPVQVTAQGSGVAAVSSGGGHTCARKTDGTLWCWGNDSQGQVGRGVTPLPFLTPVQVNDLDASVTQVSAGGDHTCALRRDGTLWCWGSNQFGQLATIEVLFRAEPRPITLGCPPVPRPPKLALVSSRDHIEASFLLRHAITADAQRIYLAASSSGKLFVLARDRAANFPLVQTLEVPNPGHGLVSVMADDHHVRVTTSSGDVVVFAKGASLTLESRQALVPRGSSNDAVWSGNQLIIADGAGAVAANDTRVWVRPSNTDDRALAFTLPSFAPGPIYTPSSFDSQRAFAFTRTTATPLGDLPARPAMEATNGVLALFGGFVDLRDPVTFVRRAIVPHPKTNAVTWSGGLLLLGAEDGNVDLWRAEGSEPVLLDRANLRTLTGHTGEHDIEIRALWTDTHDRLIFAGSTWGNQSGGPELPSFFVLERTGD